jgi:hypothetical protein
MVQNLLAWHRVDLHDWVTLTYGRRTARPRHSSSLVPIHIELVSIVEVNTKLAERAVRGCLAPRVC